ncbi:hypothetical protein [Chromobacterium subtsugae]|uniref:hypothetical protein n=1 Tax=Chromobacterium subtsugae TaxID=251747 RepID=UPI00128C5135|nr:hypothetical protein [Chromobacterium subtsugae]
MTARERTQLRTSLQKIPIFSIKVHPFNLGLPLQQHLPLAYRALIAVRAIEFDAARGLSGARAQDDENSGLLARCGIPWKRLMVVFDITASADSNPVVLIPFGDFCNAFHDLVFG